MDELADKTIIRSARQTSADQTVIRPSPGRRGGQASRQSIPSDNFELPPIHQAASQGVASRQINPDVVFQSIGPHVNKLVSCSSILLGVFSSLKNTMTHNDESGLYSRLVNEIKLFERHAKDEMLQPEIILASRYILCAMLDEAILNTPWGSSGQWSQHTLLSTFHNETAGGEKFFLLLDRMREMPSENIEILELMYLCLSLGFEGKYRLIHNGKEQIELIRDELFSLIRNFRGEFERDLSFGWHGSEHTKSTLTQYVPLWVIASVFASIMFFSYFGFRVWLFESSFEVTERIEKINNVLEENKTKKSLFTFDKEKNNNNDNIFKVRGSGNE